VGRYDYDDISRVWVLSLNESKIYQLPTSIGVDVGVIYVAAACRTRHVCLGYCMRTDLILGTHCKPSTGSSFGRHSRHPTCSLIYYIFLHPIHLWPS
jgi:hypothetical protein